MIRRLLIAAAIGSALGGLAALWLDLRSSRGDDHFSWTSHGDRYTLRSLKGQLVLFAPPPPYPKGSGRAASNDAFAPLRASPQWSMNRGWPNFPDLRPGRLGFVLPIFDGVPWNRAWDLYGFSDRDLLRALEESQMFVSAHVILSGHHHTDQLTVLSEDSDDSCLASYDGLRLRFRPKQRGYHGSEWYESTADVDSSQMSRMQDRWHRRLDVRIASVSWLRIDVLAALLPGTVGGLRLREWYRHRHRVTRHLCPTCGYDLRASKGRCPECGTPVRTSAEVRK